MYTTRIQLTNYGPFETLDIELPFDGEVPKPIVLVGENGSGKSILLSHIVNGLIEAKNIAYPETPEVDTGKVYKLRSTSYIRSREEYYFGRVDFESGLFVSEFRTTRNKKDYDDTPRGIMGSVAESMWLAMDAGSHDHYDTNIDRSSGSNDKIKNIFSTNCVLYFPPNRFDEPAWLNEDHLKATAEFLNRTQLAGHTIRRVIDYSRLRDNQNWLYDVVFDRSAFEIQRHSLPLQHGASGVSAPVLFGYAGEATSVFEAALAIIRAIVGSNDLRFGIGRRHQRTVSLIVESSGVHYVPNIFQMSSGEMALINLFYSLLRDFDLSDSPFANPADVRGVAVIDEIDLHLHAIHQHDILPKLISMFPKVQFIMTSHAPLFVLGMQEVFGRDGFAVHRLPQGQQISPEEFEEFGHAYRAFAATRTFNKYVQTLIESSQKPIVFVEGATDQRYIEKAANMLDKEDILALVELRDGGGKGKLSKIWKDSVSPLTATLPNSVVLLFDCDTNKPSSNKGKLFQRSIPLQREHPINEGIENLFSKATLEMARRHNATFFSTEDEHGATNEAGQAIRIPEKWSVNHSEKSNLCDWLCENGTADDFRHFGLVFDVIEEALDCVPSSDSGSCAESSR